MNRVVRTSTAEVNRRRSARHAVDLPCRVSVLGQAAQAARVVDIGEGGAAVQGGPADLPPGTRGTVAIDGIAMPLPFVVLDNDDTGRLHAQFELDASAAATFRAMLERLTLGKAA